MSKKKYEKKINLDLIYSSVEISKFINIIMISGKKKKAEKIIYSSFNYIKKKLNKNPLAVFYKALDNIAPMIEIKTKKFANKNYNFPCEIKKKRRISLSMKWLKIYSRIRKENKMYIKLGNEIIDAYNKKGLSIKKRSDIHKLCTVKNAQTNK